MTDSPLRLRVVTYNIHKGIGLDGRCRLDRIAEVIEHYAPDLVALQEVDCGVPRSHGEDQAWALAERLGLPHVCVGLNVRLRRGMYGNATLSRLPLLESHNVDLTWGVKKRRGALVTGIELGQGRSLELVNLHLGLSRLERQIQLRRLLVHPRFPDAGRPTVLLGDTNDWRHRLFPRLLAPAGFECATPIRRHGPPPDPPEGGVLPRVYARLAHGSAHLTFPSWFPVGGLDKVFHRGAVRAQHVFVSRLALARIASDHLPVVADLELDP